MINDNTNARKFSRSRITIAARITPEGMDPFDVTVVDLSMNGILVKAEKDLPLGTRCDVCILVGHYMHELPLSAQGAVARMQDGNIAISFDNIDIGTSDEFQSMILFHADDPEQCLQEFEDVDSPDESGKA